MVAPDIFVENVRLCRETLRNLPGGAVVECGTWRGGMSAALIELAGKRDCYFFDSFQGLPAAEPLDGEYAIAWQQSSDNAHNCAASRAEFEATIAKANGASAVHVFEGLFEHTFPHVAAFPIAVLRLDADWYSSTMTCLEKFWDSVLPGGIIVIDDYGVWEGCTKAVHDFLSKRKAPEHIQQGRAAGTVYIRKMA